MSLGIYSEVDHERSQVVLFLEITLYLPIQKPLLFPEGAFTLLNHYFRNH